MKCRVDLDRVSAIDASPALLHTIMPIHNAFLRLSMSFNFVACEDQVVLDYIHQDSLVLDLVGGLRNISFTVDLPPSTHTYSGSPNVTVV